MAKSLRQPTCRLKLGKRSDLEKKSPPEVPPEDLAEGAAGGETCATWLSFYARIAGKMLPRFT